jgi:hypothetical protein
MSQEFDFAMRKQVNKEADKQKGRRKADLSVFQEQNEAQYRATTGPPKLNL